MNYYKMILDSNFMDDNNYDCIELAKAISLIGIKNKNMAISGHVIENWESDLCVSCINFNRDWNFVANDLGWLIVSEKIQKIMDSLDIKNLDMHSICFFDETKQKEIEGYKILNIINILDCFDYQRSDFKKLISKGKEILFIKKYILYSDKIKNNHIFKIPESIYSNFVSEKLKKELISESIEEVAFIKINEG